MQDTQRLVAAVLVAMSEAEEEYGLTVNLHPRSAGDYARMVGLLKQVLGEPSEDNRADVSGGWLTWTVYGSNRVDLYTPRATLAGVL